MLKREACETCGCDDWDEFWGPACSSGICATDQHNELKKAVLEERERCAKIALSLCSDDTTQCEREGANGCRARRISLMIREGK